MKRVCDVLGVARSNVTEKLNGSPEWQDGRKARKLDDTELVDEIRRAIEHLPSYGYRRVWGVLRRQLTSVGMSAIERFLRPVTYQRFPDELLPEALRTANPLNLWRLTDEEPARA